MMLEEIEKKLSDILKKNKTLSLELEENQIKNEKAQDEILLDIISILDVFTKAEKIISDHSWNQSEDSQKAIKRLLNAKKKINTILEKHGIQKISFKDNLSNDDLCIVSDTEPDTEHPNGFILSIEKDGYLRHGKLLRRAEVIIVKN